jgi:hypothetical protein
MLKNSTSVFPSQQNSAPLLVKKFHRQGKLIFAWTNCFQSGQGTPLVPSVHIWQGICQYNYRNIVYCVLCKTIYCTFWTILNSLFKYMIYFVARILYSLCYKLHFVIACSVKFVQNMIIVCIVCTEQFVQYMIFVVACTVQYLYLYSTIHIV